MPVPHLDVVGLGVGGERCRGDADRIPEFALPGTSRKDGAHSLRVVVNDPGSPKDHPRPNLDEAEAILRKELERTEIRTPHIFTLPLAYEREMSAPLGVAAPTDLRCNAKARYEYGDDGGYSVPPYVMRLEVQCTLRDGHEGDHFAPAPVGRRRRKIWVTWE